MQTAQCLRSGVGRGGEQGGADIVGTKKAQEFLKMTTITTITTIDPTCNMYMYMYMYIFRDAASNDGEPKKREGLPAADGSPILLISSDQNSAGIEADSVVAQLAPGGLIIHHFIFATGRAKTCRRDTFDSKNCNDFVTMLFH